MAAFVAQTDLVGSDAASPRPSRSQAVVQNVQQPEGGYPAPFSALPESSKKALPPFPDTATWKPEAGAMHQVLSTVMMVERAAHRSTHQRLSVPALPPAPRRGS
jgi:hypothetical protein